MLTAVHFPQPLFSIFETGADIRKAVCRLYDECKFRGTADFGEFRVRPGFAFLTIVAWFVCEQADACRNMWAKRSVDVFNRCVSIFYGIVQVGDHYSGLSMRRHQLRYCVQVRSVWLVSIHLICVCGNGERASFLLHDSEGLM